MSNWRPDLPLFSPVVHRRLVSSLILLLAAALVATALTPSAATEAQEDLFSDSADAGVHRPAVDALAALGYFDGTECDTDMFCPRDPMKRWVMAVWLVRVLGHKPLNTDSSQFADVEAGEWWSPYAGRLAKLKVTEGCKREPLRYCPDRSVTRGQMATFLVRAFDLEPAPSAGFVDTEGTTHEANIDALAAAGITTGCKTEPLSYCPNKPVTRAQMATFLHRAIPRSERAILAVLYHATGGPKWSARTRWLSNTGIERWHGVTADAEGRVRELDLSDNGLKGSVPGVIGHLSGLRSLLLYRNELTGSIPPELGMLAGLRLLDLSENQLDGQIPLQLSHLTGLSELDLRSNKLDGPIPNQIAALTDLWELDLSSNELSGPIPPELGTLTRLSTLSLRFNRLSGPIPPNLSGLARLERLHLSGNELSGKLPAELGNLSNLESLGLARNRLEGEIPATLANLVHLTYMNLADNQLTGRIPAELGNLTRLQTLELATNRLSGAIPPELGNLRFLTYLQLGHNRLSGPIPASFSQLTDLRYLYLGGNELTGCIPDWVRNLEGTDRDTWHIPFCN